MSFDSYEEYRDLYGCHKCCYWEITPKGAAWSKSMKVFMTSAFGGQKRKMQESSKGMGRVCQDKEFMESKVQEEHAIIMSIYASV